MVLGPSGRSDDRDVGGGGLPFNDGLERHGFDQFRGRGFDVEHESVDNAGVVVERSESGDADHEPEHGGEQSGHDAGGGGHDDVDLVDLVDDVLEGDDH